MRSADTNVLVRLVAQDDPSQTRIAKAFVQGGVWVSHIALTECVWVLRSAFRFDPSRVANAVEWLLAHDSLSFQEPTIVIAALKLFQKRPSLGFTDCMMLETARHAGHLPFGTFDRDLAKMDGAEILS